MKESCKGEKNPAPRGIWAHFLLIKRHVLLNCATTVALQIAGWNVSLFLILLELFGEDCHYQPLAKLWLMSSKRCFGWQVVSLLKRTSHKLLPSCNFSSIHFKKLVRNWAKKPELNQSLTLNVYCPSKWPCAACSYVNILLLGLIDIVKNEKIMLL